MKKSWYAVRSIFHEENLEGVELYEERITLWEACSSDEAIELAEKEAKEYIEGSKFNMTDLFQAFHLFDEKIQSGSEIFSLMRDSEMKTKEYIDKYFDTGNEHSR